MIRRTWPYGTTYKATVLVVSKRTLAVADEKGEGHILIGTGHDALDLKKGDQGTIIFTEGGPTGGFWKFTPNTTTATTTTNENDQDKGTG